MQPPLFHPGQAVAATSSEWADLTPDTNLRHRRLPVKGGVYTVDRVVAIESRWYLTLVGFPLSSNGRPPGFLERKFTAVEDTPANLLAELLALFLPQDVPLPVFP